MKNKRSFKRAEKADVCLLLEGTYPYVSGGVSAWVSHLLTEFPDVSFALVFMGSSPQDYGDPVYTLPDHVVYYEEFFIHDVVPKKAVREVRKGDPQAFEKMEHFHQALRDPLHPDLSGHLLRQILPQMENGKALDDAQFLYGKMSWDMITEYYERYSTDPSFTDYFWTVRMMHKPIWEIVNVSHQIIPAQVYHTVSTGYAGFLGALLHYRTGRPLLLSEHGIYTKERKIDLLQSSWLRDNRRFLEEDSTQVGYLQDLWVRFFESIGQMCYSASTSIISLFEQNRQRQIDAGAPAERTQVIPNGRDLQRFSALRGQRPESVPLVVALIGRVVPIKDIRTFIRAIFIATRRVPELQGWIIGGEGEDPEYAQECRSFASSLGILDIQCHFLGHQQVDRYYPKIGLMALSSISEGQPLVVLEAYAAGVPVVVTDVGACRELVEGAAGEDRGLGKAGAVVPIADPEAMAQAMIDLLTLPGCWQNAQAAAVARVSRYYDARIMEDHYRQLYTTLWQKPTEVFSEG
jgi:glycosyltransferase involved in cell wall biosynthesis